MVRNPQENGAGTAVAEEQVEVRVEDPAAVPGTFQRIPIGQLRESATNPRKTFEKEALQELTDSVRQRGVLQPILVRPIAGGLFEIVAGARRYRASKAAGLADVPAIVQDLDDRATLEVQVIENLQRADLHPMEEARGYRLLMREHQFTVEQLAARVHKSRAYIYGRLRLCDLPAGAVKLFEAGELDASRALLVARIPVPELAEKAAREIAWGRWEARQAEGRNGKPRDEQKEPMSYSAACEHVHREYMLRLDQAPFRTGDAALLPAAGACTACPKRTGNQRDLFGDVRGADLCTDPKCFEAKSKAQFELRAAETRAAGGQVLEGKKADAAFRDNKLVDITSSVPGDEKHRSFQKLLGKDAADLPRTLVRTAHGDVREFVDRAAAGKLLKAKGHELTRPRAIAANSTHARQEAAHKRRLAAAKLAKPKLLEAVAKASSDSVLRFALQWALDRFNYQAKAVAVRLGVKTTPYGGLTEAGRSVLAKLPAERVREALVEIVVGDSPAQFHEKGYTEAWSAACEIAGIDMEAFEAQLPQPGKKPARGPRPPKPSTKRKKAGKGKAAAAGDDT